MIHRAEITLYDENDCVIKTGSIDYETFNELVEEAGNKVKEKNPVEFLYSILTEQIKEQ